MTRCVFNWHGKCQLTRLYGVETGRRCGRCKSYVNAVVHQNTRLLERLKLARKAITFEIKLLIDAIAKEQYGR
jgi:hypothetical protein